MSVSISAIGAGLGQSLVESLGNDCSAGAALAGRFESGLSSIERGMALDGMDVASVERAALNFAERGWLVANETWWRRSDVALPKGLGAFLAGAAAMRTVSEQVERVSTVVTLPTEPSAIARALPAEGPIHASIGQTEEALGKIARISIGSFTVLSPFVNREGAELALRLFDQSPAGRRTLITRLEHSTAAVIDPLLPKMSAKGIRVLDYLLPAEGGFETFHAKVVIADNDQAYVGSSNMTLYARHSMERGVIFKGRPARAIASVVRAVERIARPVTAC